LKEVEKQKKNPPTAKELPAKSYQRTAGQAREIQQYQSQSSTVPVRQTPEDEIQDITPIKAEPQEASLDQTIPRNPVQHVKTPQVYRQPQMQPIALSAPEPNASLELYQEEEEGYDYDQYDNQYEQEEFGSYEQGQLVDVGKGLVGSHEDLQNYLTKDTATKETCCTLCTFRNKIPAKVKNHLEAIHFPGVFVYSCNYCGKTFKGRNALGVHVSLTHSKK